ncbi:MAG: hypothetical protein EA383_07215 [Spirochaetaceae bacterium]|nr:MAG: hypothetical protein EA383_07215 [Spirochaetaceae bacterium]
MKRVFFGCTVLLWTMAPASCSSTPLVPIDSESRMIRFSGYEWTVRDTEGREGPGPNHFSADEQGVRIDDQGRLHLGIWNRGRTWYTSEVRLPEALGYGTYVFETEGPLRFSSPEVVLGLFTFDHDAPQRAYREIDIEFGQFGNPRKPDAQFVLHPFPPEGNRFEFDLPDELPDIMTHAFRWTERSIEFRSLSESLHDPFELHADDPLVIAAWEMRGRSVPDPGNARVHMNLWLYQGQRPAEAASVIIRAFRFLE